MVLNFCPSCEKILFPQKNSKKIKFVECSKCDFYKTLDESGSIISEKIDFKENFRGKIAKGENELANYENICSKCGHEKAQIIDMGVFISDEDTLILLKCGNCGFSERIGRKVC